MSSQQIQNHAVDVQLLTGSEQQSLIGDGTSGVRRWLRQTGQSLLELLRQTGQSLLEWIRGPNDQAPVLVFYNSAWYIRVWKMVWAILITLGIEVLNGYQLSDQINLLQKHPVLLTMVPVISAVGGNLGLQTSSSVTALINCNKTQGEETHWSIIGKYKRHNIPIIIITTFVMTGITYALDYHAYDDYCPGAHAVIIAIGGSINMLIASFMGIIMPMSIYKFFNGDPSAAAGPGETAIQDVFGTLTLIAIASGLLTHACPM